MDDPMPTPPSTSRTTPVTYRAAGEQRYAAAVAMSVGSPVVGVDPPDPVVDLSRDGDVDGPRDGGYVVLSGELGREFTAGGLIDLADHDRGALGGEAVRHGLAEALPGAGHEDDLSDVA